MSWRVQRQVDENIELTETLASKWIEPKDIVDDELMDLDKKILNTPKIFQRMSCSYWSF